MAQKSHFRLSRNVNHGADGGGRTHTSVKTLDFESSASANSATSATLTINHLRTARIFHFEFASRFCIPHISVAMTDMLDAKNSTARKRIDSLSKDGKWRSFPKVPNLLQYVSSENYYARIKVNGKLIRQSLGTDVWSTAKLRLVDFLKEKQELRGTIPVPSFTEAVEIFKSDLEKNSRIKPQSKKYRLWCLQKIQRSWPALWELRLDQISVESYQEWSTKLSTEIAAHYFNNTIATLKQVIDAGIADYERQGGKGLKNPAAKLQRVRIKQKELQLPEASQFHDLVKNVRKKSGGWGPRIGDLIEFLAYSGLRIRSEALWVTWEDVDWQRREIIVRGDPVTGTKNSDIRRVPIIADMEKLLKRLQADSAGTGLILQIGRCHEALARACKEIGITRLTHHDLRHLFATRCIESGVDVPTVARWLGHKDGGSLALRTYGHLRNEHSQRMAQKVTF
jgi:integrase